MKEFNVSEKIKVRCSTKSTRNGFKHVATLYLDGVESGTASCSYLNRTWESYEYQSVLYRLAKTAKNLTDEEKTILTDFSKKDHTDNSMMKSTAMIAALGDIFGGTKKESNDWKTRMLKAELGNSGLEIPEDWDTLDEDTKQKRLNAVIEVCKTGGK